VKVLGYTMTELPFVPVGIDDNGVIAGNHNGAPVVYANGTISLLPMSLALQTRGYHANAMSRNGAIAAGGGDGGLYWRTQTSTPIPFNSPGLSPIYPSAINSHDVVVGTYGHSGETLGFRWTPTGGFVNITPSGYYMVTPTDVNDAGYIVGYARQRSTGWVVPLRWSPGATQAEELDGWVATAIRENGEVLGRRHGIQTLVAWPLSGGSFPIESPMESHVSDVSGAGRLVGYRYNAGVGPWTKLGGTTTWLPLPDLAYIPEPLFLQMRVNTCGSIVAKAKLPNGQYTGVLWTSSRCDAAPPASAELGTAAH
jgi:hypothetical protein